MASYATWYNTANASGASGLADINDASYAGDPIGTISNALYWESRAYDQLTSIFLQLGANPGQGVNGNFTVNIDAVANETSSINFGTAGTVGGADPSITWNSGLTSFVFSHPIILSGSQDIGSAALRVGDIYSNTLDTSGALTIGGDLTVSGVTQLESVTVLGQLTAATLNIDTNLTIDGTQLTLLDSHTGAPTLSASLVVNRGDNTDSSIRWFETGVDSTSKWQAYNISSSAFNDLALLNDDGFTNDNVFESSGGYYGISNYAARSDHNHSGASLAATGTDETSFTIDSDYTSGPENIELRFADSTNYIRYNPGEASPRFIFSDDLDTPLITTADLTVTNGLTLSGSVTGDLSIDGAIITLEADNAGGFFDSNVDIRVNLGMGGNRNIRWDGDTGSPYGGQWKFTNDGSNYYNFIGTDASGNIIIPGDIDGAFNATSNYLVLRSNQGTDGDGGFTVDRLSGSVSINWVDNISSWQFQDTSGTYNLVGTTKNQTLTNKTLTSSTLDNPTVSSGTFSGSPSFTGTPSFSGSPTFTNAPSFSAAVSDPVFSVSNSEKIVNLNADFVDGKSVDDTLNSNAYLWSADKIITYVDSQVPSDFTPDPHQAEHQAGGNDFLTGTVGISGTTSDTFTIETEAAEPATLHLGNTGLYKVHILSNTSKTMGIGGTGVSVQPSSTGQTLGSTANRWDAGFFGKYVNIEPITSASYPSANGSIWFKAPEGGGSDYVFTIRVNSSTFDLFNSSGSLGADVTGASATWNMPSGMTTGSSSLVTNLNADQVDGKDVDDTTTSVNNLWTAQKISEHVAALNQWTLRTTSDISIEPNFVVEFDAGSGLNRTYLPDAGNVHTVTYSHATPASVAQDINNTGTSFIQDMTFDLFGHVGSVTSVDPFTLRPAFNPSNGSPFTTNSTVLVDNLNAERVGGKIVNDTLSSDAYLWTANKIISYVDNNEVGITGGSSGTLVSGDKVEFSTNAGIDRTYAYNGPSNTHVISLNHYTPSTVASDVTNTGDSLLRSIAFDQYGHVESISSYNPFVNVPAFNPSNGAPFTTTSTVKVVNLNSDLLDGLHLDAEATYSDAALWRGSDIKGYITANPQYSYWRLLVNGTYYNVEDGFTGEWDSGTGIDVTVSGNRVTYAHANTSSQTNITNNSETFINDLSFDDFGHVTSATSVNPFVSSPSFTSLSPFTVSSTNKITNLNADSVDDIHVGTGNSNLWTGGTISTAISDVQQSILNQTDNYGYWNITVDETAVSSLQSTVSSNQRLTLRYGNMISLDAVDITQSTKYVSFNHNTVSQNTELNTTTPKGTNGFVSEITFDAYGHVTDLVYRDPFTSSDAPSFTNAPQFQDSLYPFIVSSTNLVANLNADRVDGYHVDTDSSFGDNEIWRGSEIKTWVNTQSPSAYSWFIRAINQSNTLIGPGTYELVSDDVLQFREGSGIDLDFSIISNRPNIFVNHADTSSQSSVTNTSNTVIKSISVDDFGHVTSISSSNEFQARPTFTNSNGPFNVLSTSKVTNLNADRLDGYDVNDTLLSGSIWTSGKIEERAQYWANTVQSQNAARSFDINIVGTGINTSNKVSTTVNGNGSDEVTFTAGSGISLSGSGAITSTNYSVNIAHADTSSQSSVTASNPSSIYAVGLDDYGHVTSLSYRNPFSSTPAFTAYQPFTVSSTYRVNNLNADRVDGYNVINGSNYALWTGGQIVNYVASQLPSPYTYWQVQANDEFGSGVVLNYHKVDFRADSPLSVVRTVAPSKNILTFSHNTAMGGTVTASSYSSIYSLQFDGYGHVTSVQTRNNFAGAPLFNSSGFTPPFYVNSSSKVTSLNVDLVDGCHVQFSTGVYNDTELWRGTTIKSYVAANAGGSDYTWNAKVGSSSYEISNNETLEFDNGSGLDVSFDTGNNKVIFSHANTSNQGSVSNGNTTFIKSVTLDTYGHVLGLVSVSPFGASPSFTGYQPFYVSSSIKVSNLNADSVDGYHVGSGDSNVWLGSTVKSHVSSQLSGVSFSGGTVANATTFQSDTTIEDTLTLGTASASLSGLLKIKKQSSQSGLWNAQIWTTGNSSNINIGNNGGYSSYVATTNQYGTWYFGSYSPTGFYIGHSSGGGYHYFLTDSGAHYWGNGSTKKGSYYFRSDNTGSFQKQWHNSSATLTKIDYSKFFEYEVNAAGPVSMTAINAPSVSSTYLDAALYVYGKARASQWLSTSDVRVKDNINPITSALSIVCSLNGVTFNYIDNKDLSFENNLGNEKKYGLIAQEVESVIPEIVSSAEGVPKALDYNSLIPIMAEAIKELKAEVEALRAELGG